MKLLIKIPKLKLFLYDQDFCILCKFFQENLGEQAQVVVNKDYVWDLNNWNIWNFLEIKIDKIMVKVFRGLRSDNEFENHIDEIRVSADLS